MIETDSLAEFGYVERVVEIPHDFVLYLDNQYCSLKDDHTQRGIYTGIDEFGNPIDYCPCINNRFYNLFFFKNDFINQLYKTIREMLFEYCEKNNINAEEQNYHIHGFFTYTQKEMISEGWHDHGNEEYHLHGFLPVDAEPSHTLYIIDDKNVSLIAKNGRIILGKNTMHTRAADWNENRPRVSIAFNIKPFASMPNDEFYIPLT